MKEYSLCVLLTLLVVNTFSQNQTRLLQASSNNNEINRIDSLNNLSIASIKKVEAEKSVAYGKEALALAKKIGFQKGVADAYSNLGNAYYIQKKYDEAIEALSSGLTIFQGIKAKKNVADCYTTIGTIYSTQQKCNEAFKSLYSALKIYEQLNDKEAIATCLVKLGWVHHLQENLPAVLDCYFKSLKIWEERGNAIEIGRVSNLIGSVYRIQKKYEEAITYHFAALKISEQFPNVTWLKAMTMARLGGTYEDQGRLAELSGDTGNARVLYGKSLEHFTASLKIREAQPEQAAADDYWHFGSLYMKLKKYDLARNYLEKALAAYKVKDFKPFIALTYETLSTLDSAEGNYRQAYENYKLYTKYYSIYLREETVRKAMQAKLEYEFSKKEDSLQLHQQVINEKLKQQQLIAIQQSQKLQLQEASLTLSNQQREMSTLAFNKAQADLLLEQGDKRSKENELLLLQKEKALQKAQLRLAIAELGLKRKEIKSKSLELRVTLVSSVALFIVGLLLWQVYERRQASISMLENQNIRSQIASDLHDDIGPALTHISFCSEMVKMQLDDQSTAMRNMVEKIGDNARTVVNTMSDIVWIINPDNDITEDVVKRMRKQMIELCSQREIEHSFSVSEEAGHLKLNMQQRKTLYLVFKEALHNAVKYAHCSKINTEIFQKNNEIFLMIKDNGKGFNLTEAYRGNGLISMQRRADEVNAALLVNAAPGQGTCISLKLKIT